MKQKTIEQKDKKSGKKNGVTVVPCQKCGSQEPQRQFLDGLWYCKPCARKLNVAW